MSSLKLTEIRPRSSWIAIDWREFWDARELLYFLVLRDVKVRYKQTVLGAAWAVLQPLITMIIFTVIFGRFAKMPSEGVPYAPFVLAGLLPWTLFSSIVTSASQSLLNQQSLLTKIYLPRLFIPGSAAGTPIIDFCVSFVLLVFVMVWYGLTPTLAVVAIPFLTLVALVAALGAGVWLSAQVVNFRDFRFVVPFMVQTWMFVTPVVYPVSMFPTEWRWIAALNPMTGVIDGMRSALFGTPWNFPAIATSVLVSGAMLTLGIRHFQSTERRFADIA